MDYQAPKATAESIDLGKEASPRVATPPSSAAGGTDLPENLSDDLSFGAAENSNIGFHGINNSDQGLTYPGMMSASEDLQFPEPPPPDSNKSPRAPEPVDDITDILSASIGALRIAEDGQLRYYGPTSNLHVHPNGFHSLSRSTIRHVETEGSAVLERLGLDRDIPAPVEMHLARLYFAWEDPAIHVVDEETFFAEKQKTIIHGQKSPYYSETLNNSM